MSYEVEMFDEAIEIGEVPVVDVLMIRRWRDGFSASVSVDGRISESSGKRWPTWREAADDALARAHTSWDGRAVAS